MSSSKIISPCTSACKLDYEQDICIGCGRTTKEIIHWIVYSDKQRLIILKKLPQRLKDYHDGYSTETP